jgi:hypothetical protein
MLAGYMFDQLILTVVANIAKFTCVWLVIGVSTLMVFTITYRGKSFRTESAVIRLLPGVGPHMD